MCTQFVPRCHGCFGFYFFFYKNSLLFETCLFITREYFLIIRSPVGITYCITQWYFTKKNKKGQVKVKERKGIKIGLGEVEGERRNSKNQE